MLYIVILKINKDIINNIIGVGNSKKIVLQKIIFIIDKSIYIHNLFYQNSPFLLGILFLSEYIYIYIYI